MNPRQSLKVGITKQQYSQAVWDFMLEHCDLMDSGALFVKFHMSNRDDFEKRVRSRVYGYHRNDVVAKQREADHRRSLRDNMSQEERKKRHEEWISGVIKTHIKRKFRAFVKKISFGTLCKKKRYQSSDNIES
jgi:hypothetical protein